MAAPRNITLYFASQTANAELPNPRPDRIRANCQQKAYDNALAIAPPPAIFSLIIFPPSLPIHGNRYKKPSIPISRFLLARPKHLDAIVSEISNVDITILVYGNISGIL